MDYNRATSSRHGFSLDDKASILYSEHRPSQQPGLDAQIGSICITQDGTIWRKFGAGLTDWDIVFTHEEYTKHFETNSNSVIMDPANYRPDILQDTLDLDAINNEASLDLTTRVGGSWQQPSIKFVGYRKTVFFKQKIFINPKYNYRATCYVRQNTPQGDYSSFPNGGQHRHYFGFAPFDRKNRAIIPPNFRYLVGTMTHLTQPLSPGDTEIHVADLSNWTDTDSYVWNRGVAIYNYTDEDGYRYDNYTRIVFDDAFNIGGLDKTNNIINLKVPFQQTYANAADPNGVWPVGTPIAQPRYNEGSFSYTIMYFDGLTLDQWHFREGFIAGQEWGEIEELGKRNHNTVPPGTCYVRPVLFPNYTNVQGGIGTVWPDTGPDTEFHLAEFDVKQVDTFFKEKTGLHKLCYYDRHRKAVLSVDSQDVDFTLSFMNAFRNNRRLRLEEWGHSRSNAGFEMPYDGYIVSISVTLHKLDNQVRDDLRFEIHVNGAATGQFVKVADPGTAGLYGNINDGISVPVNKGDDISIHIKRDLAIDNWDDATVTIKIKETL